MLHDYRQDEREVQQNVYVNKAIKKSPISRAPVSKNGGGRKNRTLNNGFGDRCYAT